MGQRGPVPKRDEERIRRNIPDDPTVTVQMAGLVTIPELGDISHLGETHPLVVEMYEAMRQSASIKYFEPTDWAFARLTMHTLNAELISAKHLGKPIGAMKLSAITTMLSALLLTEGDRRRVRLEVERSPADSGGGKVIGMTDVLKQRLAAAQKGSGTEG